jgi:type I restriction enzyme S subunit
MSWQTESLGNLLAPSGTTRAGKLELPVLSITMRDGLVDQSSKFKKRVASQDTSSYRVAYANELVVGFPIDEGVLGFQTQYPAAVVSPAYSIWKLTKHEETYIPFIEGYLRSNEARRIYAAKMRGAVARRRSLTKKDFLEMVIPFPPFNEQRKIAALLDKAHTLRRQRRESILLTETLLQAAFIDAFGDPVENPHGWPTKTLGEFGVVQTGNTPPRSNKANYSTTGLEWIKTDNILEKEVYLTQAAEKLSEMGSVSARIAPAGSLLVACIAGSEKSIGRAALAERAVAFNQQINAITPHSHVSSLFLYFLIKVGRRHIQLAAGKGMKKIINKSTFAGIRFIAPGEDEQRRFETAAGTMIEQNRLHREQSFELDTLFLSIQQRAFSGELDLGMISLDSQIAVSKPPKPKSSASQSPETERMAFLTAPEAMESELERLAILLRQDGPMPWSADFFKYRVLGAMHPPFSFDDLMERVSGTFIEEPPYEEMKSIVMDLLGRGVEPALLRQRFDLTINENTGEVGGRKQIVFEPIS